MTAEERVKKFIETLLIRIHWQGERSEHPSDVKWLEQRVESLTAEVAPIILDAQREAEAATIQRCVEEAQNSEACDPWFVGDAIRALPSIYSEAAQP